MIDPRPPFFGLAGAARLMRFDISGLALMIGGVRGFWASLGWAMALVFPLFLLLMILRFNPAETDGGRYFLANVTVYALSWLIFPVVMERVCHFVNRRAHYLQFIIAYNWLACLYNIIYMVIALAHATSMISTNSAATLSVVLLIASLVWVAFMGRKALSLPISAMAGIVVLDLFISVMMNILGAGLRAG